MTTLDVVGQQARESLREAMFGLRGAPVTVDRFQLLEKLGAGGMGVVYAAYDPRLDRRVALKLLQPNATSDKAAARLLREARTLARLSHPNVIPVFDSGTVDGCVYIAMEYVQGPTLRAWLDADPRPELPEILEVFRQAGAGLEAAHEAGLVHRDFKPDNAILGPDGRLRVLDFGLTRDTAAAHERETPDPSTSAEDGSPDHVTPTDHHASTDGRIAGTPAYMAPEQRLGEPVDARSDLYAYCVALAEAVYGERPRRPSPGADPMLPEGVAPPWLRRALLHGLRFEAADRPPTMRALLAELEPPRPRVTPGRVASVAVGVAVVAGVAMLGLGQPAQDGPCAKAGEPADAVWNADRREQVHAGLVAEGHPYAEAMATRVATGVDAYVDAWVAGRTDACEATAVRAEQSELLLDLRFLCLDARLQDLDEVLARLEDADERTAHNALTAIAGLRSVGGCADTAALMSSRVDPPPAKLRAKVDETRRQLAQARSHKLTRDGPRAVEVSRPAVEDARALGYRPLLAEALFELGRGLLTSLDSEAAVEALMEARHLAVAVGDDVLANQASAELVEACGNLSQWELVEVWRQDTLAGLERLDWPAELERHARMHLGRTDRRHGDLDGAHEQYTRIAELDGAANDLLLRAGTLHALSSVSFGRGEFEQAEAQLAEALELREQALGSDHPTLAAVHLNLAGSYLQQGKADLAEEHAAKAQAAYVAAYGPDHVRLGDVAMLWGNLGHERRDFVTAETWFRRALELYQARDQVGDVAMARGSIGTALIEQARYDEALPFFEAAKEDIAEAHGPEHRFMATTLNNIGELHLRSGRVAEAIEAYRGSLRVWDKTPDHPSVAFPLHGLGKAYNELEQYDEAITFFERALSVREKQPDREHPLATTELALAGALWDGDGDRDRARRLASSARDRFASLGEEANDSRRRRGLARSPSLRFVREAVLLFAAHGDGHRASQRLARR